MDYSFYHIDNMKKCPSFSNHSEMVQFLIMKIMSDNQEPIGAWALRSSLEQWGFHISTATIGRYLKELDAQKYTVQYSNKGRVLTHLGEEVVKTKDDMVVSDILHSNMRDAVVITQYGDLIDIYVVRKALELEAIGLFMEHATGADLERLNKAVEEYKDYVISAQEFIEPALDFHDVITETAGNRFMDSLSKMLLHEQKKIEERLEQVITRNHGPQYAIEHERIYQAIKAGDTKKAKKLMEQHFDGMIKTLNEENRTTKIE